MTNNKIDEIIEFIEQREWWSLKEFINDTCHETEMLKEGDIKISLDELAIAWGDDIIDCDFEDFINLTNTS